MTEISPVLILHGSDEFAISSHIEKICAGLGDSSTAEMNITRFDGRLGIDYVALNSAVNSVPFLASSRVVVILHPISIFNSPEERGKFIDFLEKAQPSTSIILAEFNQLDAKHWLVQWAIKAAPRARLHVFNLPKRLEMPRWIESEAKKQGGKIEPAAAARLADMVGEDTRIAAQELTKLLAYANYTRPINLVDVEKVSIVSLQGNIFDLVDALGTNNSKKAQHVLHQLLEDEEAFKLWGMIIRQFRLLLQARELLDAGASIPEAQKELGVHDFVAQKVSNQAKHFSMPELEAIYHQLLVMDEGAKTSRVPLELSLDMLVVELAGRKQP